MKLDALAQLVDSDHDWLNATPAGKTSATTQAPASRPSPAARASRSDHALQHVPQ